MSSTLKWVWRVGLGAGATTVVCAICLTMLGVVAPNGTTGNTAPAEALMSACGVLFILLGVVITVAAFAQVRQDRELFGANSTLVQVALLCTLFFGGYIFFGLYPRLRHGSSSGTPDASLRK